MKQNFQLHYFYRENVNALHIRLWCILVAQLLFTVVQKMAQATQAFQVVASPIIIHLISMLDAYEFLRAHGQSVKPPPGFQLKFNTWERFFKIR